RRIPRECFFFSSRRRHTRFSRDWSSDVCSSDLAGAREAARRLREADPAAMRRWARPLPADPPRRPRAARVRRPPRWSRAPPSARSEERRVGKESRGGQAEDDEKLIKNESDTHRE